MHWVGVAAKAVDVAELNPEAEVIVPPRSTLVVPNVIESFARFPFGKRPVTPPFVEDARLMGGISAETRARKVGTAAEPEAGPAKT